MTFPIGVKVYFSCWLVAVGFIAGWYTRTFIYPPLINVQVAQLEPQPETQVEPTGGVNLNIQPLAPPHNAIKVEEEQETETGIEPETETGIEPETETETEIQSLSKRDTKKKRIVKRKRCLRFTIKIET